MKGAATQKEQMKKFIRAKDLKAKFGIGPAMVYKLCRESKIPHLRVGKMLLFDDSEISLWLEKHRVR